MTPALFTRVGEALYGAASWQSEIARALGVNPRSVRYWASGERPIPANVWAELRDLVDQRGKALDAVYIALTF